MSASRKKRIARLIAALDEAETAAVDRRCDLRFNDCVCRDIRIAMERRGIDPATSPVLLEAEAEAEFVDSPELQAADDAYLAAHPEEELPDEQDPMEWLEDQLDPLAQRYLDGSLPDFTFDDLMELWAWALVQQRLLPAIPDDGYGVSVNTSLVRGIVE